MSRTVTGNVSRCPSCVSECHYRHAGQRAATMTTAVWLLPHPQPQWVGQRAAAATGPQNFYNFYFHNAQQHTPPRSIRSLYGGSQKRHRTRDLKTILKKLKNYSISTRKLRYMFVHSAAVAGDGAGALGEAAPGPGASLLLVGDAVARPQVVVLHQSELSTGSRDNPSPPGTTRRRRTRPRGCWARGSPRPRSRTRRRRWV